MADRRKNAHSHAASRPGGPQQHKQALYDAVGDVMRKQAEERKAAQAADAARRRRPHMRVSPVIVAGVAVLVSIGAYVAIERPDWLFPTPLAAESRDEQEASLRMGIATTAQRIERFRQQSSRLPATLAEAGSRVEDVTYERTSEDAYLLRGKNGPVELSYRSSEPLSTFVGNSFQVLARRVHR
jgi:hypothetical protein